MYGILGHFFTFSFYTGTAGDSFSYHRGHPFSTKDRDNDELPDESCAQTSSGGWWYRDCRDSNLNSPYLNGSHDS